MKLTGYTQGDADLLLNTSDGKIRVRPVLENAVRVTYTKADDFSIKASQMIVLENSRHPCCFIDENKDDVFFQSGNIKISIKKKTCAFTCFAPDGRLLFKEPDKGGKTLEPVEVKKAVFDKDAQVTASRSVDGLRANTENYREIVDRTAYHTKLEFVFSDGEALYGLGSHEEGIMNLRGHSQYLYQQNLKAVVPTFLSTKGYGILFDSYSFMTFHDDVYGSYLWTDVDDEMDYYIIYGPEFDKIIDTYRKLTGATPLLPRWAYGYIQSKERYSTQEELIEVVNEYRKRNIPLDAVVQDWLYWPENMWGQKSFDKKRYPDPAAMTEKIHKLHAKLMVSIWPNMSEGGFDQQEMLDKGYLYGNRSTYDAFDPEARGLYWRQAKEGLFDFGVDAWWCDSTEPLEDDWKGPVKPEPEQRAYRNTRRSKLYIDSEYLNAYSLNHSKGIYEGQRGCTDEKRVVNLTRSSYAGQHRYATVTWSGDTSASFETLKKQIPAGLNFCAAGEPYWTSDIGAFFVKNRDDLWFWAGQYENGCDDPAYRELYLRWFQYGAFLPMFRSHGTDTPREVWRFGEPGTVFYDTLVRFIKLRYRLMPYIYSLAAMVTFENYTMLRMLAFDFKNDPKVFDIGGQYMFGPAFMVTPVTKPMSLLNDDEEKAAKPAVHVYLPAGHAFYDFWTGERHNGGAEIESDASFEKIPLFVPAGSIIPMGPVEMYAGEKARSPIELRIYCGADGRFVLYEDEGDGYRYEHGLFAKTLILWNDSLRELTMERTGYFVGMAKTRRFRIVMVSPSHGAGPDETPVCEKEIDFDGDRINILL